MKEYRTEQIRNVVLLSHGGAGKTSLGEALLYNAGVINRLGSVNDGTTTSDYDPDETKRKISINLSLLPLETQGHKINLIDTPGYADFVGEAKAGLRAADGAVIVVCAASGVEVGTEQVWRYAEEQGIPRLIFVNKIDRDNSDFFRALEQIQRYFGGKCVPIQIPLGAESTFQGVVDLVTLKAHIAGTEPAAVPAAVEQTVNTYRDKLEEAVAETNDDFLNKYLEGAGLTDEELRQGLKTGTQNGQIVPVLVGSALQNKALEHLCDAMCRYLPSPAAITPPKARKADGTGEVDITPAAESPLTALVFKTTADPYVGRLTYLRVFAGVLSSDSQVWNANKGKAERIGQLFMARGKAQEPLPHLVAGDIGAVAKLAETGTGDTLCSREQAVILDPVELPPPSFSVAVHPKTKADFDKMGTSLARLCEEDPTLHMRKDADTAETVLSGMGDTHLEVTAERMKRKFGVDVRLETPKVPYKETITAPIRAEYKHKKQTGGHGQYGHVFLSLEPLPRGSGHVFTEKIVGGSVPRNYIPAVEKGVLEALQEGVLARCPIVDLQVTLYDGSFHAVDSSDMAFKIAAAGAMKKGLTQGQPVLLEPIMNVKIRVPDSFTGDVMGDLNSRRAKVQGSVPENGTSVINAQAPLAEMQRYAIILRSLTQGRGTYEMEFSHREEVPAHVAQKVIEAAKKEAVS